MNDQPTMLSAVHYIRDLHEQAALLLKTGEVLLRERSFTITINSGNQCLWESGGTLQEPAKWLPNDAVRYYTSKQYPRVLFFISILFWDRYREYDPPLSDCLLTAGVAIYNTTDWNDQNWDRKWWGRWHGYAKSRRDDGTVHENLVAHWEDSKDHPKLDRILTLGRPLCEVTNSDVLKATLQPLFERVEQTIR